MKPLKVYQVSGLDDRERGFTRQVEVSSDEGFYYAVLKYEKLKVAGKPGPDEERALRELIQRLQNQGYTQLRTQLIFRGTEYLGSQEMWVEYPDPETTTRSEVGLPGWIERWFSFFGRKRNKG